MAHTDAVDAVNGPPRSLPLLVRTAVKRRRTLLICLIALVPIGICHSFTMGPEIYRDALSSTIVGVIGQLFSLIVIGTAAQASILYGGEALWPRSFTWNKRFVTHPAGRRLSDWYQSSRLVLGLRWCLLVGGFAFLAGTLIGGISVAVLKLTSNIDESEFLGALGKFIEIVPIAIWLALLAGILLSFRYDRRQMTSRFALICWIFCLYNIVLWIIISTINAFVFEEAGSQYSEILFIAWLEFLATSFAILRLLYQKDYASDESTSQSAGPGYNAINGNAYLTSARGFSLVLMLTLFVSIDIAIDQSVRLKLLQNARQLFATHYLMDVEKRNVAQANNDLPVLLGIPRIREHKIEGWFSNITINVVEIEQVNEEKWRAEEIKNINPVKIKKDLYAIAAQIGIDPDKSVIFYDIFSDVQRKIIAEQKKISLPVVGLPVASDNVAWALAGVTLVLLLLIRSRVRRVFLAPDLAIEQPWLVLDGHAGLERIAAMIWLFAVLLAPWLAHVALVVTFAVQNFAEGAPPDVLRDTFSLGVMLALLLLSAGIATLTVTDLLWLRTLRLRQLVIADAAAGKT